MEQKTKDRAIAGALIGAAATLIAAIAGPWLAPSPPGPPPDSPVTTPAARPNSSGGVGERPEESLENTPVDAPEEPVGADPACQDLGPHLVGALCVSPQTSTPGESYEVSGFDFPPNTQFILNDYESPPQGVVTDDAGEFSAVFSTDPMECKTYMISFLDETGIAIANVLHYQPDC